MELSWSSGVALMFYSPSDFSQLCNVPYLACISVELLLHLVVLPILILNFILKLALAVYYPRVFYFFPLTYQIGVLLLLPFFSP